jgi:hypothetical protein
MTEADITGVSAGLFHFLISIEGAQPAAAPPCSEMTGVIAGVIRSTESVGQLHKGAEQGGAIVVG